MTPLLYLLCGGTVGKEDESKSQARTGSSKDKPLFPPGGKEGFSAIHLPPGA